MIPFALDLGYSFTKIAYQDEKGNNLTQIPTGITLLSSADSYGLGNNAIEFEGDLYYVGENLDENTLSTTDFKFIKKFLPLILYKVIKSLKLDFNNIKLILGLSISDFNKTNEIKERLKSFKVNDEIIGLNNVVIIPQGVGVYYDYGNFTDDIAIIDNGYNTINFLHFKNGKPQQHNFKSYSGHGVVTIIKELKNYLENKYNMPFSEQEVNNIFLKKKFTYKGIVQDEVTKVIETITKNYTKKLFNTIFRTEKKIIDTVDEVVIAGGGAKILEEYKNQLPKNYIYIKDPQFSNVRGYLKYLKSLA